MHEATAIVMALQLPFKPLEPPAYKCCQVLIDSLAHTVRLLKKNVRHMIFYII